MESFIERLLLRSLHMIMENLVSVIRAPVCLNSEGLVTVM